MSDKEERGGHMKRMIAIVAALFLSLGLNACGSKETAPDDQSVEDHNAGTVLSDRAGEGGTAEDTTSTAETPVTHKEVGDMILLIGDTPVRVTWEDNRTVETLRSMVAADPLTIPMSMYGGFEQVGSIGRSLPRDDRKITTEAGDIVLYSGNKIVLFYGSNTWEYTRLGRISGATAKDLKELLGKGDVSITLRSE